MTEDQIFKEALSMASLTRDSPIFGLNNPLQTLSLRLASLPRSLTLPGGLLQPGLSPRLQLQHTGPGGSIKAG